MQKNYLPKSLLPLFVVAAWLPAMAGNVNEADARRVACDFIHQRAATGVLRAAKSVSTGDLTLAHAEASQTVAAACDYFAFNMPSGGWVVVAGDDRAKPVLAYSDSGFIDFDHLPCAAQTLFDGYKQEIELLLAGSVASTAQAAASAGAIVVEPMVTTTWGQQMPYYLQCPIYQNQYCKVGCVATAMAQVMNYWQYPTSCDAIRSYFCLQILQTVSGLPATTFDYSLLLDSYSHWDWENSVLVQDEYTEAQAQEVAKLSRYCGQAVQMGYTPKSSGAYTSNQLKALKDFGYRSTAYSVKRNGLLVANYTTEEWEAMIKTELDAGRPVLYAATDNNGAGSHAFICDGYNTDGTFHFNLGWYGTCDGWYATTALNMKHHDGMSLRLASRHEILLGVEPPEGWTRPDYRKAGDIDGNGSIDIDDLNIVINIMVRKATAADWPNADIDGNGCVDIDDMNLIINIMLGLQ